MFNLDYWESYSFTKRIQWYEPKPQVQENDQEICIDNRYKDSIAYCDEEDIFWPNLTVEEHLYLFAILNGISKESPNRITEELLKELGLESNAKCNAGHLSGGSKRKLCVILNLLENARLVLLDEPTTGLDPLSKDRLRRRLHQEFPPSQDRTLVLTTHSASEAEDHCSRIGLLVNGSLMCSGTSQELKDKFSKGFQLTVKLKSSSKIDEFNQFLVREIPTVIKKWQRTTTLQYYFPRNTFNLMSELFNSVAKIQSFKGVVDCLVRDYPMDQVCNLTITLQSNVTNLKIYLLDNNLRVEYFLKGS
ncbi:ATP-binding cassette sub-family A member 8-A [Caerostris darwini]|uniref:ATP-binding cassette sub-family A member 8-A n=1 Tax=Caerostris darwini TaxID=1538125 RepID=A0AAV4SXP6_9ARAC|nr:ATP-binding cassette sub-family A member 8-A [Caerostris darwini]